MQIHRNFLQCHSNHQVSQTMKHSVPGLLPSQPTKYKEQTPSQGKEAESRQPHSQPMQLNPTTLRQSGEELPVLDQNEI